MEISLENLYVDTFDAAKFEVPSVLLSEIPTICPIVWAKPLPKNAKGLVQVDVRRSKTVFA